MFPLLTGFSVFCLANPGSADFTRIFGGSGGNEGLGFLSICLDWQYISGSMSPPEYCVLLVTHLWLLVANPMAIPLKAQFSNAIGCILSMWASIWTRVRSNLRTIVFKGCLLRNILHGHLELEKLPLGAYYSQAILVSVQFLLKRSSFLRSSLMPAEPSTIKLWS